MDEIKAAGTDPQKKSLGPVCVDDPYQGNERYFGERRENREDSEQTHKHRMNWAKFFREVILLILLAVGGIFLAFKSKDPTLNAAGISIFSGVAGAIIRSFGENSTKKIVNE